MKTAVLLSGGVDSAVALRKVIDEGYQDISAWYIKVWLEDDASFIANCPWEDDVASARSVCEQLGVKLNIVPLQMEYYETVVEYVLAELRAGRTPSPDIFCNKHIKFKAFFTAIGEEFSRVVSGHYARIQKDSKGMYHLYQAPDPVKDQSYFLCHLDQDQLSRIYFPLGSLHKKEVRQLAAAYNLTNKNRPDSQGICFLGNVKYKDFIRHYLGQKPGNIVQKSNGKILGTHNGYWFYTIGQRTGLGLSGGPWYITDKDSSENIVYIRHESEHEYEFCNSFLVSNIHSLHGSAADFLSLTDSYHDGLSLKLRHGPVKIPCTLSLYDNKPTPQYRVQLQTGDRGIAPGQFAVFYHGNECLGAAVIDKTLTG